MFSLYFALLIGFDVNIYQVKNFPSEEHCLLAIQEVEKIYKRNLIMVECHEENDT